MDSKTNLGVGVKQQVNLPLLTIQYPKKVQLWGCMQHWTGHPTEIFVGNDNNLNTIIANYITIYLHGKIYIYIKIIFCTAEH